MPNFYMPLQWAPESLSQSILPSWSFSLFYINMGHSSDPRLEEKIIEAVGSYGKQLGHLAEAFEVVVKQLDLQKNMNLANDRVVNIALEDAATVRVIKARLKD